jgi:antitoxin component of RelBE/YafQ-DinJ toxin-antitoxin module
MRIKFLNKYIRVRVSDNDDQFLKELLANSGLTISELLRQFVAKLRLSKPVNGKHQV